jgi:hypothetical protein
MNLVYRRGLALENLDGLRRVIRGLPGANSVLLNRTGDSFFLIGFKQSSGTRKSISVEIPRPWLENAGLLQSVESAAMRFASLVGEDAEHSEHAGRGLRRDARSIGPVDAPPALQKISRG